MNLEFPMLANGTYIASCVKCWANFRLLSHSPIDKMEGFSISGVFQELLEYETVYEDFGPHPSYFHDNDRICVRCVYRISLKTNGSAGETAFHWGNFGSRRSLH